MLLKNFKGTKRWDIDGEELKAGPTSCGLLPTDMHIEHLLQRSTDNNTWETVKRSGNDAIDLLPISGTGGFSYDSKAGVYNYTYSNLPKIDKATGKEYSYRVLETALSSKSKIEGEGNKIIATENLVGPYEISYEDVASDHQKITNSLQTVLYYHILTEWDDANNQDGLRPGSLN